MAILSPFFLLTAILIRLGSRGPIFFRQERIGKDFKPFLIFKFRTMLDSAQEAKRLYTPDDDHRITGIGRLLRIWKLDELPQLMNVIKGEMSLVGPRPQVSLIVNFFRKDYAVLLQVLPGITDLASIRYRNEAAFLVGSKDPGRECVYTIFPEKIRLGREYVRSARFLDDLKIIFLTFFSLLQGTTIRRCEHWIEGLVERLAVHRRILVIAIQGLLVVLSSFLAFALRFEGELPDRQMALLIGGLPLLFVLRMAGFLALDLFTGLWRYASVGDLLRIVCSVGLSSIVFAASVRILPGLSGYSFSVILIDSLLLSVLLSAIRLTKRIVRRLGGNTLPGRRVLIIGACDMGESVLREIECHPEYGYHPIGFIDDEPSKRGVTIRGLRILGSCAQIERIVQAHRIDEIILCTPATPGDPIHVVLEDFSKSGVHVRALPGLHGMLHPVRNLQDSPGVEHDKGPPFPVPCPQD